MRRRLLFIVSMLCWLMLVPITAQETTPEATEPAAETYTRDNLYSVPVPADWSIDEQTAYTRIYSPDERIELFFLTNETAIQETDDAEMVINEAWEVVAPQLELAELDQIVNPPASGDVDALYVASYNIPGEAETVYNALIRVADEQNYIQLLLGNRDEINRRSSQVNTISTGFDILSTEEVDLSDATPVPADDEILAQLEPFIEEVRLESEIPGIAVAIVQGDSVVYQQGFGTREKDGEEPITPQTMFAIASTTKTMTTAMMASLVDDERITWDTRAVDVWENFQLSDPELTEQVTLRNLVCACIGVERRDLELYFYLDATPQEYIRNLSDFELYTDFGEAFQYNNQLIAAGGYLSAVAADGSIDTMRDDFIEQLRQRIWEPVGMDNTTLELETVQDYGNLAMPHNFNLATQEIVPIPLDYERSIEITGPAGGGFSTLEDMTAYMRMYLNDATTDNGTRIISASGLQELWTPQIDISANTQYGLGWFIGEYKGAQTLSHPGNAIGYTSEFRFFPQGDVGMIILSNARAANIAHNLIFQRFAELIYEQPDETTEQFEFIIEQTRQQRAELADQVQPIDPDVFAPYAGTYVNDTLGEINLLPGSDADMDPHIRIARYELPLRRYTAPTARDNSYIITLPPLAGLPFYFSEAGNLVIEASATDYIFMPTD